MVIAGHEFKPFEDRCSCGKRLIDLMDVTRDDIGKHGIAHIGVLHGVEFDQIEAYKERLLDAAKG